MCPQHVEVWIYFHELKLPVSFNSNTLWSRVFLVRLHLVKVDRPLNILNIFWSISAFSFKFRRIWQWLSMISKSDFIATRMLKHPATPLENANIINLFVFYILIGKFMLLWDLKNILFLYILIYLRLEGNLIN